MRPVFLLTMVMIIAGCSSQSWYLSGAGLEVSDFSVTMRNIITNPDILHIWTGPVPEPWQVSLIEERLATGLALRVLAPAGFTNPGIPPENISFVPEHYHTAALVYQGQRLMLPLTTSGLIIILPVGSEKWTDWIYFAWQKYREQENRIFFPETGVFLPDIPLSNGMIIPLLADRRDIFSILAGRMEGSESVMHFSSDSLNNESLLSAAWRTYLRHGRVLMADSTASGDIRQEKKLFDHGVSWVYDYGQEVLWIWTLPAVPRAEARLINAYLLECRGGIASQILALLQPDPEEEAAQCKFPGVVRAPLPGEVFISEVGLIYEPGSWSGEFIELYNDSGDWISLSGYCLRIRDSFGTDCQEYRFPPDCLVAPGKCLVVASQADVYYGTDYHWPDLFLYTQGFEILLTDPAGTVYDQAGSLELSFKDFGARLNYSSRDRSISRCYPPGVGSLTSAWSAADTQSGLSPFALERIWAHPGTYPEKQN